MIDLSHYCIIREDLSPGLRAAYLIHAAGESSPGELPSGTRAVALTVPGESRLRELADRLDRDSIPHTAIVEDGTMFAIGIAPAPLSRPVRRATSGLRLVQ